MEHVYIVQLKDRDGDSLVQVVVNSDHDAEDLRSAYTRYLSSRFDDFQGTHEVTIERCSVNTETSAKRILYDTLNEENN